MTSGPRLRHFLQPREIADCAHLPVLSVYRDHGVVPKDSRRDNYNKTPADLSRYQEVRAGDLVINKMKAWQGSLAVSNFHGIVSPDYLVCSVAPQVHGRFLHYMLRSLHMIAEYGARSKGIRPAQWRLYWEDLADIPLALPDSSEQLRIADFLDVEIARIDDLDDLRRHQISVIEERQQRSLSDEFEALVDTPRPRLGYLCRIQTGITVDGSRTRDESSVTRPYLRVANVQAGRLNLETVHEITVPRSMAAGSTLRRGDVLMTEGGDLDKLGRGTVWDGEIPECLHQNHVFALRVAEDKLLPAFLALYTQTVAARMHFESTGNKTTNLASTSSSKIRDLRIPTPLLQQQRYVISTISTMTDATGRALEALRRQRTLLGERRQALITAAVTGQIDVTTSRGADLS